MSPPLGILGVGRPHPLRRAGQIVDYLVNYEPRTGPAYDRRKRPSSYQPSRQELAVILRKHLADARRDAQSKYRHRR